MVSWRIKLYRFLSLGFVPTPEKTRRLDVALATMAVIIIPVAVSVHTVVSWVFSMTLRPGWHSTIFGPYFVIGAIYSGTAAIIFAMAVFQKAYHLERYLTKEHFRKLGLLLLALSVIYIYFTGCEYLTAWYGGASSDQRLLQLLMGSGPYWPIFLVMALTGLFLPPLLIGLPGGWKFQRLILAAVFVNIGMWLKRYLIVIPTMETPYIPAEAATKHLAYFPSWVELSITVAAFAMFALMYALFSKVFPILSITETAEPLEEAIAHSGPDFLPSTSSDAQPATSPQYMATTLAVLFAFGTFSVATSSARAQEEQEAAPAPKIELTETTQQGEHLLFALVTLNGEPVEGASVTFTVVRTFGNIVLATEDTFDDGAAMTEFPKELPGDSSGYFTVIAVVNGKGDSPPASASTTFKSDTPFVSTQEMFPAALWSARPLWPLVEVIVVLLLVVWSTYAFVIMQLVKLCA